ncbi:MAG: hypothetical protein KGJ63_02465 [Pseudomonadota bacterium]|jgi:hypothetical protein|nr:hypothetical protein [Pseudomonadota bacterium]
MANVLMVLAVQGCAGTASVISPGQQQSLQSLSLFNPDASPRFVADLACSGNDVSCRTVENAFYAWARDRHVQLRTVESGDAAFSGGQPAHRPNPALPYRLAIRVAPLIIPSFDESGGGHGDMRNGTVYTPPKVGYTATIRVVDAATGKSLRALPVHDQQDAAYKSDAGKYFRAEMNVLIGSFDPAYRAMQQK